MINDLVIVSIKEDGQIDREKDKWTDKPKTIELL